MSQTLGANGDNEQTRPSNEAAPPGERDEVNESEHALDAERLAALIDGTLGEAERSALIERIASSEDDSDVLADSLGALGDLHAGETPEISHTRAGMNVRRHRAWRTPWLAIAASIAVVAAISLLWLKRRAPSMPNPTQYAVALAANGVGMPPAWNDSPWTATRGSSTSLPTDVRAVRLGARLTDLEIAARSSDTSAARYALSAAALLDDMPAGAPIASMYRGIAGRTEESRPEVVASLDGASAAVRQLPDARMIEMGAWIEAARVAAASHDAEFFRTREARAMIDYLCTSPAISVAAQKDAVDVRTAIDGATPNSNVIAERLTNVLASLANAAR